MSPKEIPPYPNEAEHLEADLAEIADSPEPGEFADLFCMAIGLGCLIGLVAGPVLYWLGS